jgi:RNA-directed DNA polymerase
MLKAVRHHTDCKWLLLYIERWLKAPLQEADGTKIERNCGTPQGGVISPLLANLFLHYAFDVWMTKNHANMPWARYADDGILHCSSLRQANWILSKLQARFEECGLELHPTKTKIVYCKDANRRGSFPNNKFTFLGFSFQPRDSITKMGTRFLSFAPAISIDSATAIRQTVRGWGMHLRPYLSIQELARMYNPVIRGWINYYKLFYGSKLQGVLQHINRHLVVWLRRKYKGFVRHSANFHQIRWTKTMASSKGGLDEGRAIRF